MAGIYSIVVDSAAPDFAQHLVTDINDVLSRLGAAVDSASSSEDTISALIGGMGCGRLAYSSTTALTFTPFNGDRIKIDGSIFAIPSGGIAGLANTNVFLNGVAGQNLAAATVYYVYAFDNSDTVTADFSTTAHATSSTTDNVGVEVKSGDDTRSLIGLIRTDGSSQFVNSATQRFVRSWFNDPGSALSNFFTVDRSIASTSYVEVNSQIRIEFVNWSGETVHLAFNGGTYGDGTTAVLASVGIDGATPEDVFNVNSDASASASIMPTPVITYAAPSEGYHFATVLGKLSVAGTGTFYVDNNSAGRRPTLKGYLRR